MVHDNGEYQGFLNSQSEGILVVLWLLQLLCESDMN